MYDLGLQFKEGIKQYCILTVQWQVIRNLKIDILVIFLNVRKVPPQSLKRTP